MANICGKMEMAILDIKNADVRQRKRGKESERERGSREGKC